jgi:hypothetical protein
LSVTPQNQREDEDGAGHASRSSGLLRIEASRAGVFQSSLETGGAAAQMVHVASLWMLRQIQAEDGWVDAIGCVRPFYSNFIVSYVLGPCVILFFYSFA